MNFKKMLILIIVLILSMNVWGASGNGFDPPFEPPIFSFPIGSCQTISSSGHYHLTGNLTVAGDDCLTISASNVYLDCGDYSIIGSVVDDHYGIVAYGGPYSNIQIHDCHIMKFRHAIYLQETSNAKIYDNTIEMCGNAVGGGAMFLRNGDSPEVYGNSLYTPIHLRTTNSHVHDNTINAGSRFAIYFQNDPDFLVEDNKINSGTTGVLSSDSSGTITGTEIHVSDKGVSASTGTSTVHCDGTNQIFAPTKLYGGSEGTVISHDCDVAENEIGFYDFSGFEGFVQVFHKAKIDSEDSTCAPIVGGNVTATGTRDGVLFTDTTDSLGETGWNEFLSFDSDGTNNPVTIELTASGYDDYSDDVTFSQNEIVYIVMDKTEDESITLNEPGDGHWSDSLDVDFSFTPHDSGTITECKFLNDEGGWTEKETFNSGLSDGVAKEFPYSFSGDGAYLWKIWCENNYTHEYWSDEIGVNVDTANPIVAYTTATPAENSDVESPITIEVELTEDNLDKIDLELDGSIYGQFSHSTGNKYTIQVSLGEGIHQFRAIAHDLAGNNTATGIRKVNVPEGEGTSGGTEETEEEETSEEETGTETGEAGQEENWEESDHLVNEEQGQEQPQEEQPVLGETQEPVIAEPQPPGIGLDSIIILVVILAVLGGGAFYLYKTGALKM